MVKWAIRVRNLVGTMTSLDDDAMLKRFLDYSEKALGPRQRKTKYGMECVCLQIDRFVVAIATTANNSQSLFLISLFAGQVRVPLFLVSALYG